MKPQSTPNQRDNEHDPKQRNGSTGFPLVNPESGTAVITLDSDLPNQQPLSARVPDAPESTHRQGAAALKALRIM